MGKGDPSMADVYRVVENIMDRRCANCDKNKPAPAPKIPEARLRAHSSLVQGLWVSKEGIALNLRAPRDMSNERLIFAIHYLTANCLVMHEEVEMLDKGTHGVEYDEEQKMNALYHKKPLNWLFSMPLMSQMLAEAATRGLIMVKRK